MAKAACRPGSIWTTAPVCRISWTVQVQLVDVNVLVYAHRKDAPDHERFRVWLEAWLDSDTAFGLSDLVLSGFLRVVTHPRVFNRPTPLGAEGVKAPLHSVFSVSPAPGLSARTDASTPAPAP